MGHHLALYLSREVTHPAASGLGVNRGDPLVCFEGDRGREGGIPGLHPGLACASPVAFG